MSREPVVIFSTAYFPLVGGAEVAIREITDRLPEESFHLLTARIRPGLADEERIGNVTVHRCGFGRPLDKWLLPILAPLKARRLQRGVQKPVAWALMASYGGFAALAYTWIRPSAKLLLTLQEGDPLDHIDRRVGYFRPFFLRIFRRADAVQAISRFLADWAVRMGARVPPRVVPNGVDLPHFSRLPDGGERERRRRELGYAPEDAVLVTVSRLTKKNGVDDVIRALAELPPSVKFLVLGDGEDREKLVELAQKTGVADRVAFLGTRGHDELPALLRSADVFLRPSLSEGLGNAFLEAMACGLPIIGTPVGGIPDFLADGETGVFCQPRDPASVAAAVRRLLDDPAFRERVSRNGAALVHERYGWEGIAGEMGEILDSLRV